MDLQEAGVLRSERSMQLVAFNAEESGYIRNQSVVGFVETRNSTDGSISLMERVFTRAGEELLRAIPAKSNVDFLLTYLEHIADTHPDARISAHMVSLSRLDRKLTRGDPETVELQVEFDEQDLLLEGKRAKAPTAANPGNPSIAEKMQIVRSLRGRIPRNSDDGERP